MATLTRRALLQSAALAASAVTAPFVSRAAAAAGEVTPAGKMTLGVAYQHRHALARSAAA